jgi:hypothetical protein
MKIPGPFQAGIGMKGSGSGVQGLAFKDFCSRFRVFTVYGSGFRIQGLGFRSKDVKSSSLWS